MDYVVSAENITYYHWQLELLIESFKINQCENDLTVLLAENVDEPIHKPYFKNVFDHKKTFSHVNIGKNKGYSKLNELYGVLWSLNSNQLKSPFVMMPADMVLREPLNLNLSENYAEFIFYPNPFLTIELAEKEVGQFWEWTKKPKSTYEKNWIPVSSLFISSQIPTQFFEFVIKRIELFAVQQLLAGKQIWDKTNHLALASVLSEYADKIVCRGDYSMVSSMMESTNSPFISYTDGLLPDFHKSMFNYPVSFGNPIKILSETFPTQNSYYLSVLAQKSLVNQN